MNENTKTYPALRCRCSHDIRRKVDKRLESLCISETAYLLGLVQRDLEIGDTLDEDKKRLINHTLSIPETMIESSYCSECDLRFSMPHDGGITIYVDCDVYDLFPIEKEPIYVSMLRQIINSSNQEDYETILRFQDGKNDLVTLHFNGETHTVTISHHGFYKTYQVMLDDFCDLWLAYLHRHCVYYVAPDYLNVLAGCSFEEMYAFLSNYAEVGIYLYEQAKLLIEECDEVEKALQRLQKNIEKMRKSKMTDEHSVQILSLKNIASS